MKIREIGTFFITIGELRRHGKAEEQTFVDAAEGDIVRGRVSDASAGIWAGIDGFNTYGQIGYAAKVMDGRHLRYMRQTRAGDRVWVPGDLIGLTDVCAGYSVDERVWYEATAWAVSDYGCQVRFADAERFHRHACDVAPGAIVVVSHRFIDVPEGRGDQ